MSTGNIQIADGITPELNRIAREMQRPRQLTAALGKQLEKDFRAHFLELDRKPNKMGWPSRHFWSKQVRAQTALTEVTDERAVVTIASPEFAHKVYGGTIRPTRGKTLAIPRTAEAYKAGSPRERGVDDLDFIPLYKGNLVGALVKRMQSVLGGKNRGKLIGGDIQYFLVRQVTQAPDPDAWPKQEKIEASLLHKAREVLARVLRTSR